MYRPITASDLAMLRECEYGGIPQDNWLVLLNCLDAFMRETNYGMAHVWGYINHGDYDGACKELARSIRGRRAIFTDGGA
jgi:hypothetical protein